MSDTSKNPLQFFSYFAKDDFIVRKLQIKLHCKSNDWFLHEIQHWAEMSQTEGVHDTLNTFSADWSSVSEAFLEPFKTAMMEHFCENS